MTVQRVLPRIPGQAAPGVAVPATKAQAGGKVRLLFVDNVRLSLTMAAARPQAIILVMFHLAVTYGAEGSWFYSERPVDLVSALLLSAFVALNQAYFMGLFYFIAGYFVPGALDRKGTLAFLRDRLIRLGIPLVIFYLLISPAMAAARPPRAIEGVKGMTEGWLPGPLSQAILTRYRSLEFTPGPLWFVEGLLVFSAVYALGRAAVAWLWPGRPDWQQHRPALNQAGLLGGAVVLTLATFSARIFSPLGVEWEHLQLGAFPQYMLLFAAGVLAQRAGWLPEIAAPLRRTWSVVAILGIVIWLPIMVAAGALDSLEPFLGGFTWQSLLYSAWESFFCVGMVVGLLALFYGRFNGQNRLVGAMSAGAYTVYIIHAPIIVFLAYSLRGIDLYPLLKWALLAPVAVALCFAAAHLVRRLPLATRVL